jgi:alpha-L-fucosidase 2
MRPRGDPAARVPSTSTIVTLRTATLSLLVLALGCSDDGGNSSTGGGSSGGTGGAGNAAAAGGLGAQSGGSAGQSSGGATAGSSGTAGGGGVGNSGGLTPENGPDGHALDHATGKLNVDYASYLSKHDVVYNEPSDNPLYGLTVGNGRVGAMVWNADDLTMQISGVDVSQQTAFSGGLVRFATDPPLSDQADAFQQRLVLHDGTLTTRYASDRVVSILGAPDSELLGIHVEDARAEVTSATLDLSLWDLAALSNHGGVPNLDTWKAIAVYAEAESAGLSRGQTDANDFGYTLAASVEGTTFSSETIGSSVRLTIDPAPSYTIWVALSTRLNAAGNDSVTEAKAALAGVKNAGFAATQTAYQDFWHGFWSRSFVQYSGRDGEADYLESMYYLSTYIIAAGGYGNYPFHFINGVFRATGDDTKWSSAYWYWNQRNIYHSFLASNHPELVDTFNDLYARNYDVLKADTQSRYDIDGLWVPETMGWDGNPNGTINSTFTDHIWSTGTEAAMNMYLQYEYTGDETYLQDTAYPFMREAAKFYLGKLSKDADTGEYFMADGNAHETYWDVKNAITDLASVRRMFPVVIALSEKLGVDATLRPQLQDVLDNLHEYQLDGDVYLPHDPPAVAQSNGENVSCELIWPYDLTGLGAADYDQAVATWNARPNPYGNVWANDAIQAARLGLGDEAFEGMKLMLDKYQTYPNSFTDNTNGVFEYHGAHLLAVNESLLHSYGDALRILPALPEDSEFIARFSLAARGGFIVSAERDAGDLKYVGIKSELGNPVKLVNPWSEEVQVRRTSNETVLLTSSDALLEFETTAGELYVVERTAKLLSSYTFSHIEGVANDDAMYLTGTDSSLGIGGPPEDTGHYEAEDATLVSCSASGDNAASGFSQVTGVVEGASITFSGVRAGTSVEIGYCTMSDPGQLSLYLNDVHNQDVVFPTTGTWSGTYSNVTVNVTVPEGATLKLQRDSGDQGTNIDYLEVN